MKCPACGYELDELESPPYSLFCGECGAALTDAASNAVARPEDDELPAPVSLSVNVNRFYMEDMAGVLEFKIKNHTDRRLKGRLFADSTVLGRGDNRLSIVRRQEAKVRIPVNPDRGGEALVNLQLEFADEQFRYQYQSQFDVKVLMKNSMPANITVDQRISAGDGARVGFGLMQEKETIDFASIYQNPNDLLHRTYDPRWVSLPLDEESCCRIQLEVIGELRATTTGQIEPLSLEYQTASGNNLVHLLNSPVISLGRQRGNHIVLRCMPRSAINDRLSCNISRKHLSFNLSERGVSVQDSSSKGLRLDHDDFDGQQKCMLDRPVSFEVADALKLRATPVWGDEQTLFDNSPLGEKDSMWRMARNCKLAALEISRINNLADLEQYWVVYRWIDLPEGHLRIVRRGGRWWLVNTSVASSVHLGGQQLASGQAMVLTPGQTLELPNAKVIVKPYQQWGL